MCLPVKDRLRQARGYGLALMLVFIMSAVLVATSLSLTLGTSVGGALGIRSMDTVSARQMALIGLDNAISDIKADLLASTPVTTSYSLGGSVTMPLSPGSGSTGTVGSYNVTVVKARGITYLLKSVGTVGNSISTQYKLLQMKAILGIPNPVLVAYSLRKLLSTYNGKAARIYCASTSTTTDIGFTASGDFDMGSLRTCLGDSTLPLDITTGGKLAYGLRRLKSTYTGNAIRVRSTAAGSPEQDIGFDSNGNLDTVSLKGFVGNNSGYVKTWYDQSGSGKDVTQNTASYQPRIVASGVIDTSNGIPAVVFDGTDDYLGNTSLGSTISGANFTAFIVAEQNDATNNYHRYAVLHKSNSSGNEDWQQSGGYKILSANGTATSLSTETNWNGASGTNLISVNQIFQATSYHDSSNNLTLYEGGSQIQNTTGASSTLSPDQIFLGDGAYNTGAAPASNTYYLKGKISELIIFNPTSAMSASNRQAIERNEGHYFNVSGMQDGFVTTWYDQSGNGRNATQATNSKQPVVAQAGVMAPDGTIRPAVLFDGSDIISAVASTAWPAGNADRTLNAIYKLNATSGTMALFGWGSIGNGQVSFAFFNNGSPGTMGFWGFNNDVNAQYGNDTVTSHRVTITHNSSAMKDYIDGTLRSSATKTQSTTSNTALLIGGDPSTPNPNNWLNGLLSEIVVYNSGLSSTDRTQLETNQTNYYGQ